MARNHDLIRIHLSHTLIDIRQIRSSGAVDDEEENGEIVYACLSHEDLAIWDDVYVYHREFAVFHQDEGRRKGKPESQPQSDSRLEVVASLHEEELKHTHSIELAIHSACQCSEDPFHCHIGVFHAQQHQRGRGQIHRGLRHVTLDPNMFVDGSEHLSVEQCMLLPPAMAGSHTLREKLEAAPGSKVFLLTRQPSAPFPSDGPSLSDAAGCKCLE